MNSRLYVANLAYTTTEDSLRTAFEPFGALSEVTLVTDRDTGRPRGFGFVTFESAEHASAAITKMNGVELDGRALRVSEARPREADGTGGGGGGRNPNFGPDRRTGAFQARYRNRC
jgi:cold-inducible RNA-binding protein